MATRDIYAGDDVIAIHAAGTAGDTYVFHPGYHRLNGGWIDPRSGDSFIGATHRSAIISGAKVLYASAFSNNGNGTWSIGGQFQEDLRDPAPHCTAGDACSYRMDLFYGETAQLRVSSVGEVGPGRWYYGGSKITIGDDPYVNGVDRAIQTSISPRIFYTTNEVNYVTIGGSSITGLIIEKCANPIQTGMIQRQSYTSGGWVITDNIIRHAHGTGLRLSAGFQVLRNLITEHLQMCIGGGNGWQGNAAFLLEGNEISYGNWQNIYQIGHEASGMKISTSRDSIIRNNWFHHNIGVGCWTDIDNIGTTIENNRIEDNTWQGLYHEIGQGMIIRNNIIQRNALAQDSWDRMKAGIAIGDSNNCEIYGNLIVDCPWGISFIQQNRPEYQPEIYHPAYNPVVWNSGWDPKMDGTGNGVACPYSIGDHRVYNNYVHDNVIVSRTNAGAAGITNDNGDGAIFGPASTNDWGRPQGNNRFRNNKYYIGDGSLNNYPFQWGDWRNWTQWNAYGQDVGGVFAPYSAYVGSGSGTGTGTGTGTGGTGGGTGTYVPPYIPPGATFLVDTFQVAPQSPGAAGDLLSDHIGETGATWVPREDATSGRLVLTPAGRVRVDGPDGASFYASGQAQSSVYDVVGWLYVASLEATGHFYIGGRFTPDGATGISLEYDCQNTAWYLHSEVLRTGVVLGALSATLVVGQTYQVTLRFTADHHVLCLIDEQTIMDVLMEVTTITTRIVQDTFSDAPGTGLSDHVGELGALWIAREDAGGVMVIDDGGGVRFDGSNGASYYVSGIPSTANYDITASFRVAGNEGMGHLYIGGRFSTDGSIGISLEYDVQNNGFRLLQSTGGWNNVELETAPMSLNVGQTYKVTLSLGATAITGLVDDVPVIYVENAEIAQIGVIIIGAYDFPNASDTTGMHLDLLVVSEVSTPAEAIADPGVVIIGAYDFPAPSDTTGLHLDRIMAIEAGIAPPTVAIFTDPFDIADGTIGMPYQSVTGWWGVESGRARSMQGGGDNWETYVGGSISSDQFAACRIFAATGSDGGPGVRMAADNETGYVLDIRGVDVSTTHYLMKARNGIFSTIPNSGFVMNVPSGALARIEARGDAGAGAVTHLTGLIDSVIVCHGVDSEIPSGGAGFYGYSDGLVIDDFSCGSLAASVPDPWNPGLVVIAEEEDEEMWLRQYTPVVVAVGPFVDSLDANTDETMLAITQADVRLKKDGGRGWAPKDDPSGLTYDEHGWYSTTLGYADTNVCGQLTLSIRVAGAIGIRRSYMVVQPRIYDALIAGAGSILGLDAISAESLSDAAVDKILDEQIGDSIRTVRETLRVLLATAAGLIDGAGTGTTHIRNTANTKTVVTGNTDLAGNRTAITLVP